NSRPIESVHRALGVEERSVEIGDEQASHVLARGRGQLGPPVGTTDTFFLVRLAHSNFTTPSDRATNVKSLPRPTFRPGLMVCPTWRTMMPPARIASPPNTLTPRYCALDPRPLRVEPPPFLCAITP